MTDTDGHDPAAAGGNPSAELAGLREENALLRRRVARLEHEAEGMRALVQQVKRLRLWDFAPYGVSPDDSWVAVDRTQASELLAALASIDHWDPWRTPIEPRPHHD
jgi:hypothetical protein